MERKQVTVKWFVPARHIVLILLTLSFFGCNSGQVTHKTEMTPKQRETLHQLILVIGKVRQQKRCLSAVILTARDTKTCFDCHDKIVR